MQRRSQPANGRDHRHADDHAHDHAHDHDHPHPYAEGHDHGHDHPHPHPHAADKAHDHDHDHDHAHPHAADKAHDHDHDHDHAHPHAEGHDHDHDHDHPHPHPHAAGKGHDHDHPHPHPHTAGKSKGHDHDHDHPHPHPHTAGKGKGHDHGHDHPHPHGHDHDHEHGHSHGSGVWGWINTIFHLHGHSDQKQALISDSAFEANAEGIRTIWWALGALGLTTVLQIFVVVASGSVALLADTIHNLGDALNSVPLLLAFYLARRAPTRRYTFGFGKAEDVAGIFIVLSIAFSAGVIFWESIQKFLHPDPMQNLGWVAVASVIGFFGNEFVAWLQIRTGKKIGSAAMVADGLHARTDGLTSLAVLVAVIGTWLGFPILDPIIGILIGIAILFITRDATITMWYRLMDAIDPEIVENVEKAAGRVEGVMDVHDVRVRWLGHRMETDLHIIIDEDLPTRESHRIAEEVRHNLFHDLPHLSAVNVHVDPCGHSGVDPHADLGHHEAKVRAHTRQAESRSVRSHA